MSFRDLWTLYVRRTHAALGDVVRAALDETIPCCFLSASPRIMHMGHPLVARKVISEVKLCLFLVISSPSHRRARQGAGVEQPHEDSALRPDACWRLTISIHSGTEPSVLISQHSCPTRISSSAAALTGTGP
jgi:hypothetical protein